MSQELINLNSDLKKLRDEGYKIEVKSGVALIDKIPYVNSKKQINYGTLVSTLILSGNKTIKPDNHVIYFIGDYPCNKDGTQINGIKHQSITKTLADGVVVNHSFSNKPRNGYANYYDKFIRYIEIISAPAKSLDDSVTAKTFEIVNTEESSVFKYYDTNSSRAEIYEITKKLEKHKIGIIGLGGTGSYVLDLVSKTPVQEIQLFDGDVFYQHNAFRSPGAPSIEKLEKREKKTDYYKSIYSNIHKNIISYNENIQTSTLNRLDNLDFIFICIDKGTIKRDIVDYLIEKKKPFIDLGIGIQKVDDSLIGIVRTTLATSEKNTHISNRISFADGEKDEYSTNIQIAELNALNATLGVIKWKKHIGFYQDLNKEYFTTYTINTGELNNEDEL
jgi:hypothetical protein